MMMIMMMMKAECIVPLLFVLIRTHLQYSICLSASLLRRNSDKRSASQGRHQPWWRRASDLTTTRTSSATWGPGRLKLTVGRKWWLSSGGFVHWMEEGLDLSRVISENKLRIMCDICLTLVYNKTLPVKRVKGQTTDWKKSISKTHLQ